MSKEWMPDQVGHDRIAINRLIDKVKGKRKLWKRRMIDGGNPSTQMKFHFHNHNIFRTPLS